MAKPNPDNNERQRNVDKENGAPGNMIDKPATDDRSDGSSHGAKTGPGADRPAAILFRKSAADNGKAAGNQKRGSKSLHTARDDELTNRSGKPAPRRSKCKDGYTGKKNSPPAEAIA